MGGYTLILSCIGGLIVCELFNFVIGSLIAIFLFVMYFGFSLGPVTWLIIP